MENIKDKLKVKKDILLKMIQNIFSKEYIFWKRILIYGIAVAILGISILFCTSNYIKYQKISLDKISAVSLQEFIDDNAIIIKDQKLKMSFTGFNFNQLLKSGIENTKIPSLKSNKIVDCQYDNKLHLVYLNVADNKGRIYSFVCSASLGASNKNLVLNLSNYKLEKLKSGILGIYYKYLLGVPNELKISLPNNHNMIFIESIKAVSDDNIEVSYDYDYDELAKRFNVYKKQVDEAKLELYVKNAGVPAEIINVFTAKEVNNDQLAKCTKVLEQNSNALEKCTLLLNEQGIRDICTDLKKFYAKNINVDKVIEKSEGELDKNLRKYHNDFSTMLLKYLYIHKDYTVNNQGIYINGMMLTPEIILSENNYSKLCDIDIISDAQGISAVYKLGDKSITKVILRKEN